MSKIDQNNVHIAGDSLAACIYANNLSRKHDTVTFHTTGELGGINRDTCGHPIEMMLPITEEVKNTLIALGVKDNFVGPFTTRYVSIPYDKLKIKNKTNGDIIWPFNRSSFEQTDYNNIICGLGDYAELLEESDKTRNAPAALRKRLPAGFYTSVIKRMGVNFYCNPHGQIEPLALVNSILRLDHMYEQEPERFYVYKNGISDICLQLVTASNINVIVEPISKTRDLIRKRSVLFYITERYDYYMDYVAGGIDYISYNTIKAEINDDMDYMMRYTPYNKHSVKYTYDHVSYEATSYQTQSNDTKIHCVQAPTIKTSRAMNEYREIIKVTPSIRLL